jgi:VanZ family protein
MVFTKKIVWSWLAVGLWYLVILYFSSIPNLRLSPDVQQDEVLRVPAHFLEYGFLSILLSIALINTIRNKTYFNLRVFSLVIVCGLLLSVFDECWQSTIPTRTWQFQDLACDNAGILMGLVSYYSYRLAVNKKASKIDL